MASVRERKKISENELKVRDSLWPDAEKQRWHRVQFGGFATIPKTLPLVYRIMDELANGNVSSTYHSIWCLTWDNGFARLNRPGDMAYAAGFSGQRGERTWRERMTKLADLGFLLLKPNGNEKYGFALIPNPHTVILRHQLLGTPGLREQSYNAFINRALEIGCKDVAAMLDRIKAAIERGDDPSISLSDEEATKITASEDRVRPKKKGRASRRSRTIRQE